jgi:DNA-binding CsgD family transcriptional regulator
VSQPQLLGQRAVVQAPGEVPFGLAILTGQGPLADQPALPSDARCILTRREHEVFCLLGGGLRNVDIAGHLAISENTVETHVRNILAKLRLKSRWELRHGLALMAGNRALQPKLGDKREGVRQMASLRAANASHEGPTFRQL